MPEDYLEKCISLSKVTKYFDRPTVADWSQLEGELGVIFPPSHKQFVSTFGSGVFGDFVLLNPSGKGPFRLSKQTLLEMKETWAALARLGIPIFPEINGLVICADTGSNRCYGLKMERQVLGEQLFDLHLSAHSVKDLRVGIAEFLYKSFLGQRGESVQQSIWGRSDVFFEAVEE